MGELLLGPDMFGDLHLFINVVNGIMVLHCEESHLLRLCIAAYISMAIQFQVHIFRYLLVLINSIQTKCISRRCSRRRASR